MLFLLARITNPMSFALFGAYRSFLQVKGITRPVVLGMVISNVTNVIGNLLFIYGDGGLNSVGLPSIGLPPLGVFGCGLSTALSSLLSVAIVGGAARRLMRASGPPPSRELVAKVLRLGMPIGLQNLAEVGLFALVAVLAGRISAEARRRIRLPLPSRRLRFAWRRASPPPPACASVTTSEQGAWPAPGARVSSGSGWRRSWAALEWRSCSCPASSPPLTSDRSVVPRHGAPLGGALSSFGWDSSRRRSGAARRRRYAHPGSSPASSATICSVSVAYYWGIVRGEA